MKHMTSETVFNYFNVLRGEREAPLRAEMDPAALKSVLPDLFMLEKCRDGIVRFRLAGTRVCLVLGREMRERALSEIWDHGVRHRMRLAAETVMANRKALEIAVTATGEDGRALALEMLMLPLFSSHDTCDRILGSLAPLEPVPPEAAVRILQPADLVFAPASGPERGEADTPRGPASLDPGGRASRITYLRVFDGGRRD